VSTPATSVWPALKAAAAVFSPPFEVVGENPVGLTVDLRAADSGEELRLRYRSERGLFLRTFYLVVEAELPGPGPLDAGELVFRRRKLRWRRPTPRGGATWTEGFAAPDVRAALKRLQIEKLRLAWDPTRERWRLVLETLSGSVTVTFFPMLMTPNPLLRDEADAVETLLRALRRAPARTPA
jgi:hypothetical protein